MEELFIFELISIVNTMTPFRCYRLWWILLCGEWLLLKNKLPCC